MNFLRLICGLYLLTYLDVIDVKVKAVDVRKDLQLTYQQKKILDKFKRIMTPRLPHKYMLEEIYLIRWLRAKNFDIDAARKFLLQNLEWRRENHMDTISREDWSELEIDFPYNIDGVDKSSKPVVSLFSRQWGIRNAAITGTLPRVLRYMDKILEEVSIKIRHLQSQGQNVTQFVYISDLGDFHFYQQNACPRCLYGIVQAIDSYDKHYPGLADKIILVNTPVWFAPLVQLIRETQSTYTRRAMRIYGTNSNVWKRILMETIDASQLTENLGGTRPDNFTNISY